MAGRKRRSREDNEGNEENEDPNEDRRDKRQEWQEKQGGQVGTAQGRNERQPNAPNQDQADHSRSQSPTRGSGNAADLHSPFRGGHHARHHSPSRGGSEGSHQHQQGIQERQRNQQNQGRTDDSRSQSPTGASGNATDHHSPFRGGRHDRHRSPSRGGNPGSRQYRNNPHDWHRHNHQPDHRSPFRGNDQVQDDTPFRGRPADRLLQRQRAHESYRCHPREGGNARSRGRWSRRDEASLPGSESSYDSGYSLTDDDGPLSRRSRGQTGEDNIRKKAMSYRTAHDSQKKHIVDRIQVVVKGMIFRKMKFITSEAMFNRAMKIVLETEEPDDEEEFVRIYKTCVVGSINGKRSTCEQAGGRIVKELLRQLDYANADDLNPPYSMQTLEKLRQGEHELDKKAFQWFIGEFLACVSGKKVWGRKKYYYRVSEAVVDKGSQELVVTVSDEAFALLLYENYIEKWITRYHTERRGEKADTKITGKYTSSVMDHCLYGGWSAEGVARFNELSMLVDRDRKSANAKKAEEEVLLALRRQKFGDRVDNDILRDPEEEGGRRRVMPEAVEAFCEL